ncbi:MAG: hypothetical protein CL675_03295 [Bdellovibrionaceae bacterium]|nr:hypothetical protein [Pseudobdellovibrionaceae bacterium]
MLLFASTFAFAGNGDEENARPAQQVEQTEDRSWWQRAGDRVRRTFSGNEQTSRRSPEAVTGRSTPIQPTPSQDQDNVWTPPTVGNDFPAADQTNGNPWVADGFDPWAEPLTGIPDAEQLSEQIFTVSGSTQYVIGRFRASPGLLTSRNIVKNRGRAEYEREKALIQARTQSAINFTPMDADNNQVYDLAGRPVQADGYTGVAYRDANGQVFAKPGPGRTRIALGRLVPVVDRNGVEKTSENAAGERVEVKGYEELRKAVHAAYKREFGEDVAQPETIDGIIHHTRGARVGNMLQIAAEEIDEGAGHTGKLAGINSDTISRQDFPGFSGSHVGTRYTPVVTVPVYEGAKNQESYDRAGLFWGRLLAHVSGNDPIPFADHPYKEDPMSFLSAAEAADLARAAIDTEWVRPGEDRPYWQMIQDYPMFNCYCSEGQTLLTTLKSNIEPTPAGFEAAWPGEGDRMWKLAVAKFASTVGRNKDDLTQVTDAKYKDLKGEYDPKYHGMEKAEIPAGFIGHLVLEGDINPLWNLRGFASLEATRSVLGGAMPIKPWTAADLLRNMVDRQVRFTYQGGAAPAALIMAFIPKVSQRIARSPEDVTKALAPLAVMNMMFDVAYAAASEFAEMSADERSGALADLARGALPASARARLEALQQELSGTLVDLGRAKSIPEPKMLELAGVVNQQLQEQAFAQDNMVQAITAMSEVPKSGARLDMAFALYNQASEGAWQAAADMVPGISREDSAKAPAQGGQNLGKDYAVQYQVPPTLYVAGGRNTFVQTDPAFKLLYVGTLVTPSQVEVALNVESEQAVNLYDTLQALAPYIDQALAERGEETFRQEGYGPLIDILNAKLQRSQATPTQPHEPAEAVNSCQAIFQ